MILKYNSFTKKWRFTPQWNNFIRQREAELLNDIYYPRLRYALSENDEDLLLRTENEMRKEFNLSKDMISIIKKDLFDASKNRG